MPNLDKEGIGEQAMTTEPPTEEEKAILLILDNKVWSRNEEDKRLEALNLLRAHVAKEAEKARNKDGLEWLKKLDEAEMAAVQKAMGELRAEIDVKRSTFQPSGVEPRLAQEEILHATKVGLRLAINIIDANYPNAKNAVGESR